MKAYGWLFGLYFVAGWMMPLCIAHAEEEAHYTVTLASGIVSPPGFDFDWGFGEVLALGYLPMPGIGAELELMKMRRESESDGAFNLDQEALPGSGPSAFDARTAALSLFLAGGLSPRFFYRFKIGFSVGDYSMQRPVALEENRIWGLSYGAGLGMRLNENLYMVLDGSSQSHLVESATLGLMWMW